MSKATKPRTIDEITAYNEAYAAKKAAEKEERKGKGKLGHHLFLNNGTIWMAWTDDDGNRQRESLRTKDAEIAATRRDERLLQIKASAAPVPARTRTTLETVLNNYVEYLYRKRPKSAKDTETIIRANLMPFFGHLRAVKVTERTLDDYVEHRLASKTVRRKTNGEWKNVSRQTVNRELFSLRAAWKRAVKERLLTSVPDFTEAIDPEAEQDGYDTGVVVSDQDIFNLIDQCNPLYACFFTFAHQSGARVGELRVLRYSQIDYERGKIVLARKETKAGKRREIVLTLLMQVALDNMNKWREDNGVESESIFANENSVQITSNMIRTAWDNAGKKSGIFKTGPIVGGHPRIIERPFRIHDLRHTYNTRISESGASDEAIMRTSGHSRTSTSMRYRHDDSAVRDIRSRLDDRYFDRLPEHVKKQILEEKKSEEQTVSTTLSPETLRKLEGVSPEKLEALLKLIS